MATKEYKHEWYLKNKNKVLENNRKNWLKRLYGITLDEYNKMYEVQNGCCDICKQPQSKLIKSLAVDHCHTTGKVRSLLCNGCNLSVGNYENNKAKIEEYLNKHTDD